MEVKLSKQANKYLRRIPEKERLRILRGIRGLEKEPPVGDIETISGYPGEFHLRVGDRRIIWRIKETYIQVSRVEPRGQAYDKRTYRR